MKTYCLLALLGVIAGMGFNTTASAQVGVGTAPVTTQPPMVRIAPAANDAVQVVNNFMAALSTGNLAATRDFLDPGAIVIHNGSIRGSRDEYMAQQAKADADSLQKTQRQLLRRDARAGAAFAWVVSEKLFRTQAGGKASLLSTSETMLLAKTDAGWKIVHIHWSSRPVAGR